MTVRRERILIAVVFFLVFAAIAIPYISAWRSAGDEYFFTGFLLNPQDGNSYLAKMYQGWRGDVRFTLPYTAEQGRGAFLFLYYLLLGHLARVFGISLIAMFHLARGLSAILMFLCLYRLLLHTISQAHIRVFAFVLAALGSGLGWLALVSGIFTSDFWVAEAYPFLSAFSNPHFPLGLAIVLLLFTFTSGRGSGLNLWLSVLLSLLLAIVMPFGIVLVLLVLAGLVLWECYPRYKEVMHSVAFQRLLRIGLGGIPVLAYDFAVTLQDPLLKVWNSQNLTPSPPLWDLVLSLSPLIFIALLGTAKNYRSQERSIRLLIIWVFMGILLLYIPWGLQRRFMLGLYIPVSALAAIGLGAIAKKPPSFAVAAIIITMLVLPTNLIILMSSSEAIKTHNPQIYLSRYEAAALKWISSETPVDATILAAPESGLYIPAHTGRRVFYGHPYETAHADQQELLVTRYFQGVLTEEEGRDLLAGADYIMIGPREGSLGAVATVKNLVLVYANQDVKIYQVLNQ